MKKISIFLFAAATLLGAGCEDSSDADKVIPVSAIALDASLSGGVSMEVGQTMNIAGKVTVLPEDATDKTESYESSDTKIVTVDESGVVKAVDPGLAMITISVGGKHSHFEVKVEAKKIPVETITLPDELTDGVTLKVGEKLDIAGKVTITPGNATNTEESYESSVPMIASVSDEGIVTAIAVGETTITVTVDGKSARFGLTVEKVAVETVTLPEELTKGVTMIIGEVLNIAGKATIAPENATNKAESYDSSKPEVATVSDTGEIKALSEGKTTITVEVDGVKASFELNVEKETVVITSIAFTNASEEVEFKESGSELNLAPLMTILPADHTEGVVFASSDASVATVDENGKVTCLKVGEATITASARNHAAVKGEVKVIVCGDYDRTGWEISATSHKLPTTPTNNSKTAAFDGDANGKSNFGQTRPGKMSGGVDLRSQPDIQIWFVVDMQSARKVNCFRIRHISTTQPDFGTRWLKFVEILGSNDGVNFTPIAADVNFESQSAVLANQETGNVRIPMSEYRYLKFVSDKNCFNPTGNTAQINELYFGREKENTGE